MCGGREVHGGGRGREVCGGGVGSTGERRAIIQQSFGMSIVTKPSML